MTHQLHVAGLAMTRGGRRLFSGLDLRLACGGAAVVTGANGAGKSTLLRALAGLLRPDAGTVARTDRVALLAEQSALDPERSVRDALLFWARLDARADAAGRVSAALVALDLASLADVPVRFLSTGQRRRAAIARVAASGASMWLLDEPCTGLDEAAVTRLEALMAAHRSRGGIAVVATHQPLDLPNATAVRL